MLRVGIDVGGTFTHAVAVEPRTLEVRAHAVVPTTHRAPDGVAAGVVQALELLLRDGGFTPADIAFIAHSTTQATNALLEGDLATVGILAIGQGLEGRRVRAETTLGDLILDSGATLRTRHRFLDTGDATPQRLRAEIEALVADGAEVIVAAEAFSVDDPARERAVLDAARAVGVPATATHEVSGRLGLRVRTRTAAVNAAVLPVMLRTAERTEAAVRQAGIRVPLMVMRSDGGVMTLDEVRRRPLLTLLSGPAAGVAAALLFARVSDGVLIEVGGTSTDISLILGGRPSLRGATVGGHRLFLRTLDVRTLGVAGGSMPRLRAGRLHAVGPRSAHLAGLPYAAFEPPVGDAARSELIAPLPRDPADYAVIADAGRRVAVTTTCAANALGALAEGDHSRGGAESARRAVAALGAGVGAPTADTAQALLDHAAAPLATAVEQLLAEYEVDRQGLLLVGGGGGAGVLVPAVAQRLGLEFVITPHAPVLSAIGVALALVREQVERTIVNPTRDDLLRLRREVEEAVVRAGAAPESVEVQLTVEPQQHLVRAEASGALALEAGASAAVATDDEERAAAAHSLGAAPDAVRALARGGGFQAFAAEHTRRGPLGLGRRTQQSARLVDDRGVVRLRLDSAEVVAAPAAEALAALRQLCDARTQFGDAGPILPLTFLAARHRLTDLSGVATRDQLEAVAAAELQSLPPDEVVLLAVAPRR